ncbi:hypothetical protein [Corynebacterium vitaeruminis]|uniref:hypothetical protein n=1 Tax=Corynebacterium vitaeruminis TaxID=38305 RepID=UPI000A61435A|nr:hypothetical protein [Corynebacterium vitaeruminis]
MFDQIPQIAEHVQNLQQFQPVQQLQQFSPVQHIQQWAPQVPQFFQPRGWVPGLSS